MLAGVNVALGVTGSIAAVRTVELAHELRRQGASVRAVMTDSAQSIVHPWAVAFATEADVVTEAGVALAEIEAEVTAIIDRKLADVTAITDAAIDGDLSTF